MATKNLYVLHLCGDTINFRLVNKSNTKNRFDRQTLTEDEMLGKKRNACIARAIKIISSIKSKPHEWVTLTFAGLENQTLQTLEYGCFVKIFSNFTKALTFHHPDCWFFRKIELKHGKHFHYHMCGSLEEEEPQDFSESKKAIANLWVKTLERGYQALNLPYNLDKDARKHAIRVKPFRKKKWTYMTKADKAYYDKRFIQENKGGRMFAFINKHNVIFYEHRLFHITQRELERIKEIMAESIDDTCCNADDIFYRFSTHANQITYSKDHLLRRAVLSVVKEKE